MQAHTAENPIVSILIVGFQSSAIIGSCLRSIPESCQKSTYETLLIDNGDGSTASLVADQFPGVTVIPGMGNVGFAAGNNILAKHAKGRLILLLNPDVELLPNAIDRLVDASTECPAASAWGGVTLDKNSSPDLGNTVHVPSLKEMASRVVGRSSAAQSVAGQWDKDAEVEVLSGSFVMISRTAWDEVEGLDDRYFLYCEEVDFFYRLSQRGHVFRRIAAARAIHNIGHGTALSPKRMLYRAAGNMQFARLHWSRFDQHLAFFLTWLSAWQRFVFGWFAGRWAPRLKEVGESHRDIALLPHYWRNGYHPQRGLLAKLNSQPLLKNTVERGA